MKLYKTLNAKSNQEGGGRKHNNVRNIKIDIYYQFLLLIFIISDERIILFLN